MRVSKRSIRVSLFVTGFFALMISFQNCAKPTFTSDPNAARRNPEIRDPGADPSSAGGDVDGGRDPGNDPNAIPPRVIGNDPNVPCPVNVTSILIIDLKSGWWEGDGAGTFSNIAKQISNQCSKITIEYGHITIIDNPGTAFPKKPFNDYDEIWVLSGSASDSEDLRLSSTTFQRFLTGIVNSNANLFLGTGNGAIYHTNAITTALGYGNLFNAGGKSFLAFTYPDKNNISAVTQITKSQMRAGDPLFASVSVLPDTINVNGDKLVSDKLVSNSNLDYLITNSAGVAQVARINAGSRKIVLEANLARMYAILVGDANVRNYMVNIMTSLSQ